MSVYFLYVMPLSFDMWYFSNITSRRRWPWYKKNIFYLCSCVISWFYM